MNKLFWLFIITFVLLNAVQAYISGLDSSQIALLDEGTYKSTLTFLNVWRYWVSGLLAVSIAIFPTLREFFGPAQVKKAMKQALMETIISDVFNGEKLKVRVTIFKDIGWTKIFLIYLWHIICHPIVWFYSSNKQIPKYGKYVIAIKRIGTENEKAGMYFYYSPKSFRESEGIAGYVRQTLLETKREDLPDINNVNLDVINIKSRSVEAQNVRTYMKDGYIRDINTLKRLHIRARHFYGNILYNSKAEPVGVLVIDSNQDQSPFDDVCIDKLGGFVKLFSATF